MVRRAQRANPDTPGWWAVERRAAAGAWIPCARVRRGARRLTDVDYFLVHRVRGRELEWVPMQPSGEEDTHEVTEWYDAYYGRRAHCYHPEECAAVILAEWFAAEWARPAGGGGGDLASDTLRDCEADRALLAEIQLI